MTAATVCSPIPPESERQYQAAIVELARALGYRVYHTHDSRRSDPGFPDLVIVKPPRLLIVELKAQRGRLTRDQEAWLEDLAQCSGPCTHVWRQGETSLAAIAAILRGEHLHER